MQRESPGLFKLDFPFVWTRDKCVGQSLAHTTFSTFWAESVLIDKKYLYWWTLFWGLAVMDIKTNALHSVGHQKDCFFDKQALSFSEPVV